MDLLKGLFFVNDFRVDDVVVGFARAASGGIRGRSVGGTLGVGRGGFVELFRGFGKFVVESGCGGFEFFCGGLLVFEDVAQGVDFALDGRLGGVRNFACGVFEHFFRTEGGGLGLVAGFDAFARFAIFFGVELGFFHEAFDFGFIKAGGAGDGDFLFFVGAEIFGGNVKDAVGVNVEGDFDLWHAARGRRDAVEVEGAEAFVVLGHRALALEHDDFHGGLVIAGCGEFFCFARGDGGVARDHWGGHTAKGLDREGERSDVEEQHVFDVAAQHATLDGRANGYDFVGVDALVGVFTGELFGDLLDFGHTRHAADEDEFVNLGSCEAGVLQAVLDGEFGALGEGVGELLEFGTGESFLDVLGTSGVGRDEGEIDVVGLG